MKKGGGEKTDGVQEPFTAASLTPSRGVKCGLICSLIKLLCSRERTGGVGPEVVHTDSLVN